MARKGSLYCLAATEYRVLQAAAYIFSLAHDSLALTRHQSHRPRSDSLRSGWDARKTRFTPAMNSPQMRRGHRKRISALRLSSDSAVTALPVYTSPSTGWHRPLVVVDDPTDLPPEYPDSAEEADEDTDTDDESSAILYAPPPSSAPLTLPARRTRRPTQSGSRIKPRRSTSTDPYLDSLLARSVHALEMSNALLQSSMSTQATLNNVLASGSQGETSLETHARNLSSRIGNDANWMADLDMISKGVEGLFEEDEAEPSRRSLSEDSPTTSCSLPADYGVLRWEKSTLVVSMCLNSMTGS